jgi:hypothetical protein
VPDAWWLLASLDWRRAARYSFAFDRLGCLSVHQASLPAFLTWFETVVRLLFGRFEGMKNYGPVHRVFVGYQVMIESKMGKAGGWRILQA